MAIRRNMRKIPVDTPTILLRNKKSSHSETIQGKKPYHHVSARKRNDHHVRDDHYEVESVAVVLDLYVFHSLDGDSLMPNSPIFI